jgi:hypothetical protein
MSGTDPDDMDRLVDEDEILRTVADERRDTDEGGAVMSVPAPHRPSPHDSAIALPLPVEGERE